MYARLRAIATSRPPRPSVESPISAFWPFAEGARQVRRLLRRQVGVDGPVFLLLTNARISRSRSTITARHGLHAAGGEAAAHFVPQQRRDLVAHQPVQHAARLLRVHQVDVDLAGFSKPSDGLLGDLVEHHAVELRAAVLFFRELFLQVPADGFAFAVRVGRQVDGSTFFRRLASAPA
jgi:hypothetical protein